jgi:hypothetical protein
MLSPTTEESSCKAADPSDSIRILFWNVHKNDLSHELSLLVRDLTIDVVVLLEYIGDPASILLRLRQCADARFAIPNHTSKRFLVMSRSSVPDFEEVFPAPRFSFRRFRYQGEYALLAAFHGFDPLNYDITNRSALAREMIRDLRQAMEVNQTNKALIIGDFNFNPYDSVMNEVTGFNAMMTKGCLANGARKLCGQEFDFFYNPMWSFLGDLSPGSSGTIYYKKSQGNYGWNMFDQVLLHQSLAHSLMDVQIIHAHPAIQLANKQGRPNSRLSDHFPLVVSIKR